MWLDNICLLSESIARANDATNGGYMQARTACLDALLRTT